MSPERGPKSKLNNEEMAVQVLNIYTIALQDHSVLKNILSECSLLDYFGKIFYGREKVLSQLMYYLLGSSYELSSLNINMQLPFIDCDPMFESQGKLEEDLGVNLISSPKLTFPSLSFSTPRRNIMQPKRRIISESLGDDNFGVTKKNKLEDKDGILSQNLPSQDFPIIFPKNLKYLTAYGTIRYARQTIPNMNPKRIKKHSLVTFRDRFCQLQIGFESKEHFFKLSNCKIWTVKYSVSSRVTPRNLLSSFNEAN